jgi:hypothetical protein
VVLPLVAMNMLAANGRTLGAEVAGPVRFTSSSDR